MYIACPAIVGNHFITKISKNCPELIHRWTSGFPTANFRYQVYELFEVNPVIHRSVAEIFSVVGLLIVLIKRLTEHELLLLLLTAFVAGTVNAVANGSRFVRQVFLVLVALLIVKFARDTLMAFL